MSVPEPEPFTIHVPDDVLHDLHRRLAETRWPPALPGGGWTLGSDPAYLRELLAYWRVAFDWRAEERRLNAYPRRVGRTRPWSCSIWLSGSLIRGASAACGEPAGRPWCSSESRSGLEREATP
jgi:hypothetical protein